MFVQHPPGELRISSDGRLLAVDPAGARLFGFASPADMVGTSLEDLIPDLQTAASSAHDPAGTCRCRSSDGTVWVARLRRRADGDRGEATLTVERAVDEVNELVASVLDSLPNIVFLKDRQHHALFVNQTFADFMGRRREEVIGRVDHEYLPAAEADVFVAVDDVVFDTGQTWENEECFTTPDGRKHTFITRKSLHHDRRGRAVLLGVSTEITERKESEEALRRAHDELEGIVAGRTRELKDANERLQEEIAELQRARERLRESEQRYRKLFEMESDAIVLLEEEDGQIVEANQAATRLYGYTHEEFLQLRNVDVSAEPEQTRQRTLDHSEWVPRRLHRRKDGSTFLCELMMRPVLWRGRSCQLVTIRDITERERANEELFRAEKMATLGQIVAGVAHEINNPNNFVYFNLPVLRRYIDALRPFVEERRAAEPGLRLLGMPAAAFIEDIDRLLENMQHGSRRITAIVGELKSYVRAQAAEERHPGSIEATIDRVMTLVGKQVRTMVKRLDVEVAGPLPPVVMNAGRIEQVLVNLLINAGQAADKEDSHVTLAARPAGRGAESVELTVSDNGCGIAPTATGHIFDPFFTTKEHEGGTGLGLSIVQRIVNEHGGTVSFTTKEGVGTTFTVILPAVREPPR